ncbi:MAG: hypothetical protein J6O61_07620 [Butyrivibrio sp.]|uniref:hypothetical protein n=1 Tax=Butyrivibrio sp. TaxID=28121 RepID=UPI001B21A66E|nr:hypothetical protein [Butyrivibrio sp.]MBO6240682.1 hypothetical protein [Butyrivibrio sp.]
MQKKFLVSLTATATAFSMLVAPSLTAFAEDSEVLTETQSAHSGEVITIDKDIVITDGSSAITASGSETEVTMNGHIDQQGTYEYTTSNGNTYTAASAAVSANSGASVTVNNDIVAGGSAISMSSDSSVTVNGNINVTGVETTVTVHDNDGNKIDEYVTVNSRGISSEGDGNVTINGDINTIKEGILINPDDDDQSGSITVTGTISISDDKQQGIEIYSPSVNNGGNEYSSEKDMLNDIPDITIYEITGTDNPISVMSSSTSQDIVSKVKETVLSAINYIIKKDAASDETYGINISGDDIEKHGTGDYDTINVNDSFIVALDNALPEGYEVNAGDNVSVKQNDDGTYALTLTNNKGGIYVNVRLIPVTNSDGSTSYIVENEPSNEESASSTSPISEGAIVIANTSTSADAAAASAAISGDKPARMVSYDIAKVTPAQYKESIISNVAAAPEDGALNIETDRVACFDKKMIDAIAARPDIDVNVVFTYGGKKLKVTIPAGYDVNSLLDKGGYCGFLRLMSILGSTEL